jgi:hypothetical protein
MLQKITGTASSSNLIALMFFVPGKFQPQYYFSDYPSHSY